MPCVLALLRREARFRHGTPEVDRLQSRRQQPRLARIVFGKLFHAEAVFHALVQSGVPERVADDLLWLTLSIVRGLAIRRLWQHDPPRFNRLFRLWREMVAAYLASPQPAQLEASRHAPRPVHAS